MALDPRFVIDVIYPTDNSAHLIMTVPAPPLAGGYALAGAPDVSASVDKLIPICYRVVTFMDMVQ